MTKNPNLCVPFSTYSLSLSHTRTHTQKRNSLKRNSNHHKFGSSVGLLNKSRANVAASAALLTISTRPSTTVNPIYEYSEEKVAVAELDFHRRSNHLRKMCAKYDFTDRYPPNAWEFFISPGHGIAWCNVFKAASSTWMYYFNILGKCAYHFHICNSAKTKKLHITYISIQFDIYSHIFENVIYLL